MSFVKTEDSDRLFYQRRNSINVIEIHVYKWPLECWDGERMLGWTRMSKYAESLCIIKAAKELNLKQLRKILKNKNFKNFSFLKNVGRSFTMIFPEQEDDFKLKHFVNKSKYSEEIFLLPNKFKSSNQEYSPRDNDQTYESSNREYVKKKGNGKYLSESKGGRRMLSPNDKSKYLSKSKEGRRRMMSHDKFKYESESKEGRGRVYSPITKSKYESDDESQGTSDTQSVSSVQSVVRNVVPLPMKRQRGKNKKIQIEIKEMGSERSSTRVRETQVKMPLLAIKGQKKHKKTKKQSSDEKSSVDSEDGSDVYKNLSRLNVSMNSQKGSRRSDKVPRIFISENVTSSGESEESEDSEPRERIKYDKKPNQTERELKAKLNEISNYNMGENDKVDVLRDLLKCLRKKKTPGREIMGRLGELKLNHLYRRNKPKERNDWRQMYEDERGETENLKYYTRLLNDKFVATRSSAKVVEKSNHYPRFHPPSEKMNYAISIKILKDEIRDLKQKILKVDTTLAQQAIKRRNQEKTVAHCRIERNILIAQLAILRKRYPQAKVLDEFNKHELEGN